MIVVDASVLANALTDDDLLGERGRADLARDPHWVAPEHVLIETFSAIRGRCLGGRVSEQRAREALDTLAQLAIELLGTKPLLPRMWQLRGNVAGYDAAYVAAAEAYDCPLLTADARLARAHGLRCPVRLSVPA